MSWGRRPLAPSISREAGVDSWTVRSLLFGSKPISKSTGWWVCRRCQSQIGRSRPLNHFSSRPTAAQNSLVARLSLYEITRSVSDNAASKNEAGDANGVDGAQDELPSHKEGRKSRITRRFNSVMDNMQANIFFAGQRLNDLTGYSGIEKLKREIEEQERALKASQERFTQAKREYTAAIQQRSDSQREVNELLQRKNNWSPQDLERFTSLYRNDHANEQAEQEAQQELNKAEKASEEAGSRLSARILRRYHEEQIWSDKIRRMSTWGTWGLMGVNVLLFLLFQIGVEPWRRARLVRGFEEKVIEALETQKRHSNKVTGEALAALQATHTATLADGANALPDARLQMEAAADEVVAEEVAAETGLEPADLREIAEPASGLQAWLPGLKTYQAKVEDAFSGRETIVRQVDLTQKLLEGLFAGVMLTSIVATMIRGR